MRCNAPSFLWPSEYSYRLCADSFVQLPLRTTQSTSVRVGWVGCHSRDQGWQTLESVEKLRHVYQSDFTSNTLSAKPQAVTTKEDCL
jgi:hypothetical protein